MRFESQNLSLRELQARVMDALLGESAAALSLIAAPTVAAVARLGVYRNNVRSNFLDALQSSYPVIRRLVGEDYFRQLAREFHRHHPSTSGDLLHAGKRFPGYLAHLHAADEFSYLADVAQLEWIIQESLLAALHAPLDLARLAGVAPSAYEDLRFDLHPASRLFESRYPTLRIWEANVGDTEPEMIDLGSGADRLAVARHGLELKFHRLSRGEYDFLNALRGGEPLSAAVAGGAAGDAEFDASASLRRFVAAEVVVDFHYRTPGK